MQPAGCQTVQRKTFQRKTVQRKTFQRKTFQRKDVSEHGRFGARAFQRGFPI
jgi:hypothetical protein